MPPTSGSVYGTVVLDVNGKAVRERAEDPGGSVTEGLKHADSRNMLYGLKHADSRWFLQDLSLHLTKYLTEIQ